MDELNGIIRRGAQQSPTPEPEDIIDAEFTEEER
jgi:hypothetical protein